MRNPELILAGAVGSHFLQPMAARRDLDDARAAVAVGDINIALRIPGQIGWTLEGADRSVRMWVPSPPPSIVEPRAPVFEVFLEVIDGFRRPAKLRLRHGLRIKLDDHAGALFFPPHVVVFLNADG